MSCQHCHVDFAKSSILVWETAPEYGSKKGTTTAVKIQMKEPVTYSTVFHTPTQARTPVPGYVVWKGDLSGERNSFTLRSLLTTVSTRCALQYSRKPVFGLVLCGPSGINLMMFMLGKMR